MSYGKITQKQQEILEYLKKEIISRGYPPSVREICEAVDLRSTSSVHSHLVDNNFNLTRKSVSVPILGSVAAGMPLLAVENVEGYFPIPIEYMPNTETFMLHVKGESMINAGIYDGDKVLVQKQSTAENGDFVVAMIEDGVTVKTFYKEDDHIRLQPENDFMEPLIYDDVQIIGKVIGLFRMF